jgi:hypothetical protein
MLHGALDGLELALRWLGAELDALANISNRLVAERLLATANDRIRKPR